MLRRSSALALTLLCCLLGVAARAYAQNQVQVKPWFLVVVDTSGSMQDTCTNYANNAPTCTTCTGTCPNPITSTVNSCGLSHTRINDAKCALRNILNSTGDAEFALMQFRHPCRTGCDSRAGGDIATTCDADMSIGLSRNNYDVLVWVDGTATVACGPASTNQGTCTGGVTKEIYAYGSTPIAKSLTRAKEYFTNANAGFPSPTATDAYAGCRPVAVILLTDGGETCDATANAPANAADALQISSVPTPTGNKTIAIKTYAVGFGLTPGDANIEAIATKGKTDAPGQYLGFYAQDEDGLSAALNQIITNSQLNERCDGRDNDCDNRIDEDNPKFCDFKGIRTANPQVLNATNMSVAQSTVDSRVPACSGSNCPAVSGVQGNTACAAPEWALSSTCSTPNILCTSPGEVCDGKDDDCDGHIDEGAAAIADSNEICGDNIDNDCDGSIDEGCNGCIAQPEICNNLDDDCDTRIDETLSRACGSNLGECMAGAEACTAGAWAGCTAVLGSPETCNNKDDDCDGVIDGVIMTCGSPNIGLCRSGERTCTAGMFGMCQGGVDPAPEVCDNLDNDCDGTVTDDGADDARVGKACGSSLGVCMQGTTICDHGEIRCTGGTGAAIETCDGLDNDCDGNIDEGVSATDSRVNQACVVSGGAVVYGPVMVQGQCRLGSTVCSGGMLVCPGFVGPTPELCDQLDQDCDGNPTNGVAMTDPRVGAGCGTSVGECDPGQITCTAGALVCSAAPPGVESCNGLDDDCDGLTDEHLPATPTSCDSTGHGNRGECKIGQEACLGGGIVCAGEVTPSPEVCDNKDNNCNGTVDEGNPDANRICGSAIGECRPSMTVCADGQVSCPGSTGPSLETCDGKDNDCDGLVDEGNPQGGASCGTDADGHVLIGNSDCRTSLDPLNAALPRDQACGECRFGTIQCSDGKLSCHGTVGPRAEICDGLDNDCDSPCVVDNSNPQHPVRKCPDDPCRLAKTDPRYLDCDAKIDENADVTDPNLGVICFGGSGECKQGTNQCLDGVVTCVGGQNPTPEVCNGRDDDCDTLIDEGFGLGDPCGTQVGECAQGVKVCDPARLTVVCDNEKTGSPELCDGLDNDCNGIIDDGNPGGGAVCGSAEGACKQGMQQCMGGKLQCAGAQGPVPESCDCIDNDCDGKVDENPAPGSSICAGAAQCTMCQCAQPCRDQGEFAVLCPTGKASIQIDNQCLCVGEQCNDAKCAAETLKLDDKVLCTPGSKLLGACLCKNNTCVARCDGVVCSGGLVCDAADGICKERSCLLAQFACAAGEFCDIATLACAADPCASKTCDAGKACRGGECIGSCAGVTCQTGQSCHSGSCQDDRCSAVTCEAGKACDPTSGRCVSNGLCVNTGCKSGYVCNAVSGACEPDPCLNTTCPSGQVCRLGECEQRCAEPLLDCNDTCINPNSSRDHCGAAGDCQGSHAGLTCTGSQVCSEGNCTDTCFAGLINCSGGCIDPTTDALHCGASGKCEGLESGTACASGTTCRGSICLTKTAGSTASSAQTEETRKRVAVGGGGGCTCTISAAGRDTTPPLGAAAAVFLLLWRRRSRLWLWRSLRAGRTGLVLLTLLLLGGCKVNQLCLNCIDDASTGVVKPGGGGSDNPDAMIGPIHKDAGGSTRPDAQVTPTHDAGGGSVTADSGMPGGGKRDAGFGCVDTELCNGIDDDCDGKIDEGVDPKTLGIDTQTDEQNCGVCGHVCMVDHAFSKCVAGQCQIDSCDPEYTDADHGQTNGCEYRCTAVAQTDVICDHRDDDCDQKVDDEIDFTSDPQNCGSCGNACEPANAPGGGYCDQGICKLDAQKCKPGFVDADGVFVNGCEYQCTVRNDGVEICNNADDDCDRRTDEGVATTDARLGISCGVAAGSCLAGVQICGPGGVVECQGGRGPTTEVCNGIDDDCDGNIDESYPQRGTPCGADLGACTRGIEQCMLGQLVCIGATGPTVEVCDGKDNDCDGRLDETSALDGPPQGVGQSCRTLAGGTIEFNPAAVVGDCRLGTAQCTSGRLLCAGEIGPKAELCDANDQDCNGDPLNGVLMTDPLMGAPCGTDVGECKFGVYICSNGMRTCDNSGGKLPTPEVCNGKDDDCDGNYDETDSQTHIAPVGAGEPCRVDAMGVVHHGSSETVSGECKLGQSVCSGGFIACPNYVGPQPELCDDLDQDCDGNPVNGVASTDARIGAACPGLNLGACRSGTQYCTPTRTIGCQGVVPPSAEVCDGLDNNCDGSLADDGSAEPMLNMACGANVGVCTAGTVQCIGGAMGCSGQTIAVSESCDSLDNDCDGKVDEDFQLMTNVNRCGSCGNACAFDHATARCVGGSCGIASCAPNYYDSAAIAGPDCSVGPCTIAGNEICNGRDDNCNGQTDEGLVAPAGVCNTIGACAGAVATCQGANGWVCDKLPASELCNGADDNCNGQTDEGYPLGQSCAAPGVGACATSGTLKCNDTGTTTVCKNASNIPVVTGTPGNESCNGQDDDCDGSSDEACPSTDGNCVSDDWVSLGAGTEIYRYEASRPDATAVTAGSKVARACSAVNRLPWTNLTYLQARAACAAADPKGRLCTEGEWEQACMNDAAGSCSWGFPDYPACNSWVPDQCNGVDYSATATAQASGQSGARNACYRGPSSDATKQIFELTGNIKEYVVQRGTGGIPVRGGASNNTQDGLRCDFDFPIWPNDSAFSNVGFRCCRNATALPPQCGTFQNLNLNATNATLATNQLSVSIPYGTITDVNVINFKGTHNTMTQVDYMELVGPDGTAVRLTNASYCGATVVPMQAAIANWSYAFDTEAAGNLPPSGTPCGGGTSYKPAQPLTVFNGKNANGNWTIRVHDTTSSNGASSPHINSWGVQICVNAN